jgi:phage gp36-like protein
MSATPYTTPLALIDQFGEPELIELSDLASPRTYAVDLAVLQRACDRANAEVNGNLRARYTLPLASVPELLPYLAADLARYYLYAVGPPTYVQARFDAARKTLRDIQSGAQPLGIDQAGNDVTSTPSDLPDFTGGEKVFARGTF